MKQVVSIYSSIQDLELQSLEDGKLTTEVKISQKKVFVVDDNVFWKAWCFFSTVKKI